jgi:hypothetical protein
MLDFGEYFLLNGLNSSVSELFGACGIAPRRSGSSPTASSGFAGRV